MKLTQQDIGGEIISIITKGMYSDPKDALREYIQNGIDANAEKIDIKIRQDKIIIRDYGDGMDKVKMRKSIRIGMSDKNPGKNVGFMGIGLYSSFHLCDKLTINSKVDKEIPNKLEFDFKSMRDILHSQKNKRIDEDSSEQVALLSLLEKHITFTELSNNDLPTKGTRVELMGIESNFFQSLAKIDEIAEYLESVIPLPFDPHFIHGKTIEKKIQDICIEHSALYNLIDLNLDVNGNEKTLYRPYKDSDFKLGPLDPTFEIMNFGDEFLGIAWGCLNKDTTVIKNETVRGFLIKKNGFTIGNRSDVLPRFNSAKYFNRYVGEFLILHPKLLPNGPRSDFEYSSLRTKLYAKIEDVAVGIFNNKANVYQEEERAEKDLNEAIKQYKEFRSQLEFFEKNGEKLLEFHRKLTITYDSFKKKVDTSWKIRKERKNDAAEILEKIKSLSIEIQDLINNRKKNNKKTKRNSKSTVKDLSTTPNVSETSSIEPAPDDLVQLIELIGLDINDELKAILQLLDEKYIQGKAKNEENYANTLLELRNDIEELFEE